MLQKKNTKLRLLTFLLMTAVFAAVSPIASAQKIQGPIKLKSLNRTFKKAAVEFGVPVEILKTISHSETRFDNHRGAPSQNNDYGLMHLADNNENQTLNRAAAMLGVSTDVLKTNDREHIRGGAAILRVLAKEENLTADERAKVEFQQSEIRSGLSLHQSAAGQPRSVVCGYSGGGKLRSLRARSGEFRLQFRHAVRRGGNRRQRNY